MTDVALSWDNALWRGDVAITSGDLARDDGLRTAVILSLFLDAPAHDDDVLPAGADRRGWWGDALAETAGTVTGSRLWLLARSKQLGSVLGRARDYALEALQWLLDDGIAAAVDVDTSVPRDGVLGLSVAITRPDGPGRQIYDFLWEATA